MRAYGNTNAAPYASAPAVGLAGDTYWNTTTKILYVSDGTAWIAAGPGAGGPPTGAAGGDLGAPGSTYPNPTITDAAKSKWSVSGATLTPTDATKIVACAPISNGLQWGPRTTKGRLLQPTNSDSAYVSYNKALDASNAWLPDDNTKASWSLGLRGDTDRLIVERQSPAPGGVITTQMMVDATGQFTLPGDSTQQTVVQGTQTAKTRLIARNTAAWAAWSLNNETGANVQDDATKVSWEALLRVDADQFQVRRRPTSGGALTVPFYVNGTDGKTYCTLADRSVTQAMLQFNSTIANFWSAALPASWNGSVSATWVQVVAVSVSLTAGRWHLVWATPGWAVYGAMNTAQNFYVGWGFDGAINDYSRFDMAPGTPIGSTPGPSAIVWVDGSRATGAHTYSLWIWRSASITVQTQGDAPGALKVFEFV
jgi:hypothetical protein